MEAPVTVAALLAELDAARAEWDALLAAAGDARLTTPGVVDSWSLADIMAHVTWYDREMLGLLRAHAMRPGPGDALWMLPAAERNAAIFAANRDRAPAAIRAEAQAVYPALRAAAATLTDADLGDATRFPGMPSDWEPWRILAENTYAHYREHIPAVRAWLGATG